MNELEFFKQQSMFSAPGRFAALWDEVQPTIPEMKATIEPLIFHYRAHGDWYENGIDADRIVEIDLRYTDAMLSRIEELDPIESGQVRPPAKRMIGCCRDWALLFVSLARHHGFAARSRVGFANYFADGWWIDHTVAEIWDETRQRWLLVDAELPVGFRPASGDPINPLDVPRARFLPGLDAWRQTRSGALDPDSFVVAPELTVPELRGVPYLWHNVVHDLAALNRYEMVLWDVWGIDLVEVNEIGAATLDRVAAASTLDEWQQHFQLSEFSVPQEVLSYSPYRPQDPQRVHLGLAV